MSKTSQEQIEELLKDYNGYDFCGEKACSSWNKANELTAKINKLLIEARIEGAKNYNRVMTDNLGKCEYTTIDDGVVGIYRQEVIGNAIRKANDKTIVSTTPSRLTDITAQFNRGDSDE